MVTVLISSYKEGPLLETCVLSAATAGRVVVFEGPVGDAESSTDDDARFAAGAASVHVGRWKDDADKRTAMLHAVQKWHERDSEHPHDPLWILWLDGDELLLWGEYLSDWTRRAEAETGAGGFTVRLVELDGSVALCHSRVVRGDLIERYDSSILNIDLKNGMTVSLPNIPICAAGGVPIWTDDSRKIQVEDLARLRPPLHGEPHILHRPLLRDPSRQAERQHIAEARWYDDNDPARIRIS